MVKFEFRGKSLEELKAMPLKEFSQLIPSRERRSLARGFTPNQKKLLNNIKDNPKGFHRTTLRQMVVIPEMLDIKLGVHNGKEYVPLEIKPEMLGKRLGEFVLTRKPVKHSAPGFGATKSSKFVPLK